MREQRTSLLLGGTQGADLIRQNSLGESENAFGKTGVMQKKSMNMVGADIPYKDAIRSLEKMQ